MQKSKDYGQIKFSSRVVRKAIEVCRALSVGAEKKEDPSECSTTMGSERWSFDDLEEFFSSYAHPDVTSATLNVWWKGTALNIHMMMHQGETRIFVKSKIRSEIESVFSVFEEASPEDKIAVKRDDDLNEDKKFTIFIGHGRNTQWEKLKSHLQDKHSLEVTSYETGARAGHTIRDILDSMSAESSLALLVLTGEDKTDEGVRARQNVIHECGLFKGD